MVKRKKTNRKGKSWWSSLRGWQRAFLAFFTVILTSLFVFYLYDILGSLFPNSWWGIGITGGLLLLLTAITSWSYVASKVRSRV